MAWNDVQTSTDSITHTEWNNMVTALEAVPSTISEYGITATSTELNYVDGTSTAIQTQLNGKAPTSHTQKSSTISDFDTEVSNNSDVSSNTSFRTTPSTVITAGTNVSWSGATLNASAGSTSTLESIGDVTVTSVGDNELLAYDSTSSTWINQTAAEAGIGGGGDVSKVGTPVDSQIGVWTGDGTIEGTSTFTFNGTALDVVGNITVSGTVDGIDIATDVAANTGFTAAPSTMIAAGTNLSWSGSTLNATDTGITDVVSDTTPQLGGDLDLNSNGFTVTGQTVGGSDGDLVYLSSANTWTQADADASSTCSSALGLRVSSTVVLTHGVYTTSGLTAASKYYASATAGDITATAPSTTGQIVRIVGYALSTTEFLFNPDGTYVEVA